MTNKLLFYRYQILIFLLLPSFYHCSNQENIVPSTAVNAREKFNLPTHSYCEVEANDISCIPYFEVEPADSSIFPQWCSSILTDGTAVAFREDHYWKSSGGAGKHQDNIIVYLYTADCETTDFNYGKERLSIRFSADSPRCISLNALGGDDVDQYQGFASFRYIDWDVTYDRFATKKDENNLLEITKLDTINNVVEGRFIITFQRSDALDFDSIGPEVFSFVNGRFSCMIRD